MTMAKYIRCISVVARKIAIAVCIEFTASVISMPTTFANEPIFSPATIQPTVKVVAGGIEIAVQEESGCHVAIYAITGQLVKQIDIPSGITTIDLTAGYYIVKCGNTATRVAIR